MTYREAAMEVLKHSGAMHYKDLAETIVQSGLVQTAGANPEASLNTTIAVDINGRGRIAPLSASAPACLDCEGCMNQTHSSQPRRPTTAMRRPTQDVTMRTYESASRTSRFTRTATSTARVGRPTAETGDRPPNYDHRTGAALGRRPWIGPILPPGSQSASRVATANSPKPFGIGRRVP